MKKIEASSPEAQSANIVASNIDQLKALFPELVTEGAGGVAVNVDVLKALVGDNTISDADEKYGLNWHGKRRARQLALTPSTGTLRRCPDESVDWGATQNLMIEGDNLEVLKLLQKSYASKVKLIYIDPPYNTGKDFVYPDNFQDNIKNYLEITGQVEGGRKVSSNTEASGRFHTDWLNMMYPRLKLAHFLLSDDGAIFISIADHEIHNLRHVLEEMIARYRNTDHDPRGPWLLGDLAARNFYGQGRYPITTPSGKVISGPPAGSYWRVSKEKFRELDADGRIWWGTSGENRPGIKRFFTEVKDGVVPQTYWAWKDVGSTRHAKQELSQLMEADAGEDLFITPKPVQLIKRVLQIGAHKNALVLDFFAGSGTTFHSALEQNAEDSGSRRCISVQLPEPLPEETVRGDKSIAGITKERLRRAGAKIKAANPMFASDTGFRVFKLDTSNIRAWNPDRDDLAKTLFDHEEHLLPRRTEADILYELLLKLGLDLCVAMEKREIVGKNVHAIGGGVLLACLAEKIASEDVELLAQGIVAWHKELVPAGPKGNDSTCVFRDSAFADDVAKTNLAAILNQHGIGNVRSL